MILTQVLEGVPAYLLILVRVASFFAAVPIFSYRNIPAAAKIGTSVVLAWLMDVSLQPEPLPVDGRFFLLLIKESIVGLSIGFIAMILIYALQVAGEFIDVKMGLAMATIFDPHTSVQAPVTGNFLYTLAILFLLSINAHYMLLDGIFYSYRLIPLETLSIHFGNGGAAELATEALANMFVIAFQMSVPIVGTLFLVDVALGIVSRAVPQVNVFIVGIPFKVLVGYGVLLVTIPLIMGLVAELSEEMTTAMRQLMQAMGGRGS
ncbi:MAG TPA: flagellar biosynthetic protein FliR [Bacillales bacterium]|nr:flagellar biosynthetic protein FliR [Bacillales bacterium]